MIRYLQRILGVLIYLSFIAILVIRLFYKNSNIVNDKITYTAIGVGFTAFFIYQFRLRYFRIELNNYFRNILAGKYDIGLKNSSKINDEIGTIANLANKSASVLNAYDKLRADRTSLSYRIMDSIYQQSQEAIALFDKEKNTLKFNPSAQKLLDIRKESHSLETLESIDENNSFIMLLKEATEEKRIDKSGTVKIKLPVNEITNEVEIIIKPFKNKKEEVITSLIYLRPGKKTES